jgi:predicted transcriptional regulator
MENRAQLLANLFDKKTIEVLKKLLLKDGTFYLRDISRDTSVSLSTTFRIVQKLMGLGLVEKDQVEKFTIYKVKRDSAVFQDVYGLVFGKIDDPASQIRKAVSEMYPAAAYKIYKTDDKEGKIFVVSSHIKQSEIEEMISSIVNITGKKPACMLVTPEFFENMQTMGLVNKDKLVKL